MKVGTDGVLLGSWTSVKNNPFSILDIGSGSGLIALMLAQRSDAAQIDAIEIDVEAYEQCVENFEDSPWNDRLFCFHASLNEFVDEMEDEQYDLIVSNPPFFVPNTKEHIGESRKKARFYDSLPFEHLVSAVSKLLAPTGTFAVIIPFAEEEEFIELAKRVALFPNRVTRVKGAANSPIKRTLIELSFTEKTTIESELVLEIERHQYTQEFTTLVSDFYLNL